MAAGQHEVETFYFLILNFTLVSPYFFDTIDNGLLVGNLVNHEVALHLRWAQRFVHLCTVISKLNSKVFTTRPIVKPSVHKLKLMPSAMSHKFFYINAAWSDQRRIQPFQIVCGHENDSCFCRCYTIKSIKESTKGNSVESLVRCFLLCCIFPTYESRIDVFEKNN